MDKTAEEQQEMYDDTRGKAWEIFQEIGRMVFAYGLNESEDVVSYIEAELKAAENNGKKAGMREAATFIREEWPALGLAARRIEELMELNDE